MLEDSMIRIMPAALSLILCAAAFQQGGKQGGRKRQPDHAPKVGEEAPNFRLQPLWIDPKKEKDAAEVELKEFRGKSPVVMIFGSYT